VDEQDGSTLRVSGFDEMKLRASACDDRVVLHGPSPLPPQRTWRYGFID
jgi:hypothetical protein